MRKKDREITDRSLIEALLDEAHVLRLALSDSPVPCIVPLNFVRDGENLYVHSAKEGRKLDLIRRNGAGSFEIDLMTEVVSSEKPCEFSTRYRSVIGSGSLTVLTDRAEKERALILLMEKYGGPRAWRIPEGAADRVEVIRLRIEQMTGKQAP